MKQSQSAYVNFEEAIKIADNLVYAQKGKRLLKAEILVLKAAWYDKGYEEIAENSPFSVNYLQRSVAPRLWDLLSEVLGNGAQVGKKKLRYYLEKLVQKNEPEPAINVEKHSSYNTLPSADSSSFILGVQPPDVSNIYGRIPELAMLKELVVENRCVVIYGVAGVGKSALAAKLIHEIYINPQSKFNCLIWKSIQSAPSLQELVTDLIELLASPKDLESNLLLSGQTSVSVLLKYLQSRQCLLVLDGADAVLQGNRTNPYGEQYAEYGMLFRKMVTELKQSCLILTSRFPFSDLMRLQRSGMLVHSLKIEGLNLKTAMRILRAQGLKDEEKWGELLQPYVGNPLVIKQIAERIKNFFGGSVAQFLKLETTLGNSIFQESLEQQFNSPGGLTRLEKQIVLYLAQELADDTQTLAFTQLLKGIKTKVSPQVSISELIEALESLAGRSLIDTVTKDVTDAEAYFTLQPLVKKHILKALPDLTQAI